MRTDKNKDSYQEEERTTYTNTTRQIKEEIKAVKSACIKGCLDLHPGITRWDQSKDNTNIEKY